MLKEISPNPTHDALDAAARARLEAQRKTIEERLAEREYIEQLEKMIADIKNNGYFLVEANVYEGGEYLVQLEHGKTQKPRYYGFEFSLPLKSHISTPEFLKQIETWLSEAEKFLAATESTAESERLARVRQEYEQGHEATVENVKNFLNRGWQIEKLNEVDGESGLYTTTLTVGAKKKIFRHAQEISLK